MQLTGGIGIPSDDVEMDQLNHSAVESDGAAEVDEEAHSNR
jgi:hypothetical protein